MARFKLRARSVIHPGNALVESDDGNCYIYFADFGELSSAAIDPTLAEAMLQCYEWSPVESDDWMTLTEIEVQAAARLAASHGNAGRATSNL